MKVIHKILGFLLFCTFYTNLMAQNVKYKIAVFAPIYLDTAFEGNTFNVPGNYLPKIMLPGLEFYNGVMLAIDSLKKSNINNLEINIYDNKSSNNNIESIISSTAFDNTQLIIASFNNRNDLKTLSTYANTNQVPLVSATFPNDGGISNNPYFFLVNSSLRTHCKGLLNYIEQYNTTSNLIFIARNGALESMVKEYFIDGNKKMGKLLKINYKELNDSFTIVQIKQLLDSTKKNVIIGGTTNENYISKLINSCKLLKNYKIKIIGLPTWDGLKVEENSENKNVEIIYSSVYNFDKNDLLIKTISNKYKNKFDAKPSDMVFKGFETMLRFAKILSQFTTEGFLKNINNPELRVFNTMKFVPSKYDTNSTTIDYFENVHLYFLKK